MMNTRTLLLAVAAVATAGVTAFLIQGWMERQRAQMNAHTPVVAPKPEGHSVLVAKNNIGAGSFVKPGDLRWQVWPEGNLSPAYVVQGKRKESDFVGSVVRAAIVAGQPITDSSVVKAGERGFLAAVLTPGSRAVSVPVTATSAIAGLVFPGDRVDLILSHKFEVKNENEKDRQIRLASETVLTNVRILAIDQSTDDQNNKKKLGVPKTATIEVTPKQAEMVSVALNLGQLSLSLRSLAQDESEKDPKKTPEGTRRGRTLTRDSEVSRVLGYGRKKTAVVVLRGGDAEKSLATGGEK
jgi:pilus assembly protein CpaB